MSSSTTPSASRLDGAAAVQPSATGQPGPPPRYGQRAATAIVRFAQPFLYPSRPPSAQGRRESVQGIPDNIRLSSNTPVFGDQRNLSLRIPQSDVNEIEKPIAAIDASPDRTHVVLAGRDVLRTASINRDGDLTEDVNILKRINAKHRDQLAVVDVRWSRHYGSLIATAAWSGRIVLYDLNRPSFEYLTLYEHFRQVHKLAFNPHGGTLFLSGSHDGSIKLWDIREARDNRGSKATFQGPNQGIRDVKWSSTDAFEFAAGTDSGVVQRWDMRKPRAPVLQLNAHDQTCHSIDYHPCSKHLVTAGMDKKVKVWDTTRTDRRQNACWQVQAPQSVFNVCWRPGSIHVPSEDGFDYRMRPSSQIATSYDANDLRVHVWDFGRPNIPSQEIDHFEMPTTAILWQSAELLWSAGGSSNGGFFSQTDVDRATRPIERLNVNVLAVGPDSSMVFFSDSRSKDVFVPQDAEANVLHRTNTGDSSNGERLGSSLGTTEGSFEDGSSLLSSTLGRRRGRAVTPRLIAGASRSSDTTMAATQIEPSPLQYPLSLEKAFETSQIGAYGKVRGISETNCFKHLANSYQNPRVFGKRLGLGEIADLIEQTFLQNSVEATQVGDSGLAHTWRILAWSVKRELEDWSTVPPTATKWPNAQIQNTLKDSEGYLENTGPKYGSFHFQKGRGSKTHDPSSTSRENFSNQPTPKVRPQDGLVPIREVPSSYLESSLVKPDDESGLSTQGEIKLEKRPSTEIDRFQTDHDDLEEKLAARRAAMSTYRMTPRSVLKFDNNFRAQSPVRALQSQRPGLQRYDSGESFDILSESVDSNSRNLMIGSLGGSPRSGRTSLESIRYGSDRSFKERSDVHHNEGSALTKGNSGQESFGGLSSIPQSQSSSTPSHMQDDLSCSPRTENSSTVSVKIRGSDVFVPRIIHHGEIDSNETQKKRETMIGNCNNIHEELKGKKDYDAARTNHDDVPELGGIEVKPWHASSFLPALLNHHLDYLSSLQLPVFLTLYLHPFYPHLFPTAQTPRHVQGQTVGKLEFKSRMTYSRLVSVVLSYHAQLVSLRQFRAATNLRRTCEDIFPELGFTVDPGVSSEWWCRTCQKISKGRTKGRCNRCSSRWGGCSVCGLIRKSTGSTESYSTERDANGPETPERSRTRIPDGRFPKKSRRRWFYCQTCGHGGHASCVVDWLKRPESEGSCPVPGCRHACGPGAHRDEVRAELARRKAEVTQLRRGNGVIRDEKVVRESRAVKAARPGALEVEVGDVWNDNVNGVSDTAAGGIPMESIGGPGIMGMGVAIGRGRWRPNRRSGRGSIGNGGVSGSGAGATSAESGNGSALSQQRQQQQQRQSASDTGGDDIGVVRGPSDPSFGPMTGATQSKDVRLFKPEPGSTDGGICSLKSEESETSTSVP